MGLDDALTNAAGLAVIVIGLVSLTEALLQAELIGSGLPLVQGTFTSLVTIAFGGVLLTEDASKALTAFRTACGEVLK